MIVANTNPGKIIHSISLLLQKEIISNGISIIAIHPLPSPSLKRREKIASSPGR
jgi:hypothetical protein